jgi:hypothetical protein
MPCPYKMNQVARFPGSWARVRLLLNQTLQPEAFKLPQFCDVYGLFVNSPPARNITPGIKWMP